MQAFAAALPQLWRAETTSPRDRLLRTLIADVALLNETDPHAMRGRAAVAHRGTDELAILCPGPGRIPPRHWS